MDQSRMDNLQKAAVIGYLDATFNKNSANKYLADQCNMDSLRKSFATLRVDFGTVTRLLPDKGKSSMTRKDLEKEVLTLHDNITVDGKPVVVKDWITAAKCCWKKRAQGGANLLKYMIEHDGRLPDNCKQLGDIPVNSDTSSSKQPHLQQPKDTNKQLPPGQDTKILQHLVHNQHVFLPLGTVVQLLGLASQAQHRAVACDDHNKAGVPPKGATGAAAAAASSVVSSAEGRKIRTDAATVASDTCEEDEYSSDEGAGSYGDNETCATAQTGEKEALEAFRAARQNQRGRGVDDLLDAWAQIPGEHPGEAPTRKRECPNARVPSPIKRR